MNMQRDHFYFFYAILQVFNRSLQFLGNFVQFSTIYNSFISLLSRFVGFLGLENLWAR